MSTRIKLKIKIFFKISGYDCVATFPSPRPGSEWTSEYGIDEASMSEDPAGFDTSAIDIHHILGIVQNVDNTMEMN